MSQRTRKTVNLGNGQSYEADYTDHSVEIAAMRDKAMDIVAAYPGGSGTCPGETRKDSVLLVAGAALLECHDDTGISLDNWVGPLEVVLEALTLIGLPYDTFLPNGV